MFFGSRLNRLATSIRRGISKYSVGSDNPGLVFDFIDNFYQKDKNQTVNFDGAITHARAGNATMTDGYGPELVTNGGFDSDSDWTLGTGWSIQNNRAYHASGSNSNITQNIAVEAGKAYILEFDILEGSANFLWFAVDGVFTAIDNPQVRGGRSFVFTHDTTETIAVGVRAGSSNVAAIDNVSVREMPVIKWAPHNLLQYSEQFDLWAGQTNVSVTPNAETSPDGTQTADALVYSATNGIIQRTVQNLVVGASYTFSVWLKADSNVTARIGGFVSGFTDAVTVNVTTEWQQFYVEASVVQTSRYPQIRSDGADTIYVWGAHVYRSDLGGMVDNPDRGDSYVPTAAVAKYLPRVGHHVFNGSAWVNEGVLAESESRVNLDDYSDFSGAYTETRTTLTANQAVSPDGTENASEITENTATGSHYIVRNMTITASLDYTISVYVKQGSGSRSAILRTNNEGADDYVVFDFATESITETGNGVSNETSQDVGNGWYRIAFTYTQSADTSSGVIIALSNSATPSTHLPSYTGDGTSSLFVYGAQLEAGSTPSSLIPTSGSTVSRAAETFTIPSANLPWNDSHVSIAMDGRVTYADEDVGSNAGFFDWRRTTVDYLRFYLSTSGTRLGEPRFEQRESNSGKTTVSGAGSLFKPDVLVPFNISGRFGSTFINGAVDGVSLTESTAPTALADLSATDLDLAYDYMGTIGTFRVWDKDLGDDGIVEATNPSLEPSLSLTFEGTGTNSFVVNNWSN
jgi:hypothetical protein